MTRLDHVRVDPRPWLQTLEVLADLGHGRDERLRRAPDWIEAGQNADGRWTNRQGPTWVTLRACTVLRAAYG